ncbi:MAG: hypothetical protein M3P24_04180, partial [Gemmatimonadota bacterium]|nr:hypothetical protein [Gemmatimonadota bacterium]
MGGAAIEVDPFRERERLRERLHLVEDCAGLQHLELHLLLPRFQAGEGEDLLDQLQQVLGAEPDTPYLLVRALWDRLRYARQKQVGIADHGVERRAQL